MTTIDTDRLRKPEATPGPWVRSLIVPGQIGSLVEIDASATRRGEREVWVDIGRVLKRQDTEYAIATGPDVVLALLDRIEALTAERDNAEVARLAVAGWLNEARRENAELKATIKALEVRVGLQEHPDAVGGFSPGPNTDPWDL